MACVGTGKVREGKGLREALEMVRARPIAEGILRVLSKHASGRIAVRGGRFVVGAHITSSGLTGYAALKSFLALKHGMFYYLEAQDAGGFADLEQSLGVDIDGLLWTGGGQPDVWVRFDQMSDIYGWDTTNEVYIDPQDSVFAFADGAAFGDGILDRIHWAATNTMQRLMNLGGQPHLSSPTKPRTSRQNQAVSLAAPPLEVQPSAPAFFSAPPVLPDQLPTAPSAAAPRVELAPSQPEAAKAQPALPKMPTQPGMRAAPGHNSQAPAETAEPNYFSAPPPVPEEVGKLTAEVRPLMPNQPATPHSQPAVEPLMQGDPLLMADAQVPPQAVPNQGAHLEQSSEPEWQMVLAAIGNEPGVQNSQLAKALLLNKSATKEQALPSQGGGQPQPQAAEAAPQTSFEYQGQAQWQAPPAEPAPAFAGQTAEPAPPSPSPEQAEPDRQPFVPGLPNLKVAPNSLLAQALMLNPPTAGAADAMSDRLHSASPSEGTPESAWEQPGDQTIREPRPSSGDRSSAPISRLGQALRFGQPGAPNPHPSQPSVPQPDYQQQPAAQAYPLAPAEPLSQSEPTWRKGFHEAALDNVASEPPVVQTFTDHQAQQPFDQPPQQQFYQQPPQQELYQQQPLQQEFQQPPPPQEYYQQPPPLQEYYQQPPQQEFQQQPRQQSFNPQPLPQAYSEALPEPQPEDNTPQQPVFTQPAPQAVPPKATGQGSVLGQALMLNQAFGAKPPVTPQQVVNHSLAPGVQPTWVSPPGQPPGAQAPATGDVNAASNAFLDRIAATARSTAGGPTNAPPQAEAARVFGDLDKAIDRGANALRPPLESEQRWGPPTVGWGRDTSSAFKLPSDKPIVDEGQAGKDSLAHNAAFVSGAPAALQPTSSGTTEALWQAPGQGSKPGVRRAPAANDDRWTAYNERAFESQKLRDRDHDPNEYEQGQPVVARLKRKFDPAAAAGMFLIGGVVVLVGLGVFSLKQLADADNPLSRARKDMAENRPDKAIDALTLALEKNPDDIKLSSMRGDLYLKTGDLKNAAKDYAFIIERYPAQKEYGIKAAALSAQLGNYKDALAVTSRMIERFPADDSVIALHGVAQCGTDDPEEALKALSKIKNENQLPADIEAQVLAARGKAFFALKKPDQAVKAFADAIKMQPKNDSLYIQLAHCYEQLADYKNAAEQLKAALALVPSNGLAYDELGKDYDKFGFHDSAAKAYKNAVNLLPKPVDDYTRMANDEIAMGHYSEALSDCDMIERLDHFNRDASKLRDLIVSKEKSAKPVAISGSAIGDAPTAKSTIDPNVYAGYDALRNSQWYQAAAYLNQAVKKHPNDAQARLGLATADVGLGKSADAYTQFSWLEKKGLVPAHDKLAFARCAVAQGKYDEATKLYTDCVSAEPNWIEARVSLIRAYINANQKQKAKIVASDGVTRALTTTEKEQYQDAFNQPPDGRR